MAENTLEVSGEGADAAEQRANAEFIRPNVTNVQVQNNQLIITGNKLGSITKINVKHNGFKDKFEIESKSNNQIIANSIRHISFLVDAGFSLILSNALGSATFNLDFTIPDGAVDGKKLNRMTANDGEVLAYNATNEEWEPYSLSGLNLIGSWDPVLNNNPQIESGGYTFLAAPTNGDYYVLTQAHDFSPSDIDGVSVWAAGDWIFWDQTKNGGAGAWVRIQNTSVVTRVNGKSGDATINWADIPKTGSSIDDIVDVDTTTSAPTNGQVLKWNGSKWTAQDDDTQTFQGVVTSTVIQDGTISNVDINASAGIEISKIANLQTELDNRLSLTSGGTVGGDIDMGGNNISNVGLVDGENVEQLRTDIDSINSNLSTIFGGTTLDYVRGNGTRATLNTTIVPEGSNLYFTNTRVYDATLAGYAAGTDLPLANGDTLEEALGKIEGQITQVRSDAAGGGDLKKDGTVAMEANFNLGNNAITNGNGLTSAGIVESTEYLMANGLFGSNVTLPAFQFEVANGAAGLTDIAGTVSFTKGDATVTGVGTAFLADFSPNAFIYVHGLPYKVSSVSSATSLELDVSATFTASGMAAKKGKAAIAYFDSFGIPTYSFDAEEATLSLGSKAVTDKGTTRIKAVSFEQTENDGTYNTTMLDLQSKSYIENANSNAGEQRVIAASGLRNANTDASPTDSGTLASQVGVEVSYGHSNADVTATPQTTMVKGIELLPYNKTGTIATKYDIHVVDDNEDSDATNNYGLVLEGANKENVLEGTLKVGGAPAPAQGGTKMVVHGNIELTNGGIFYGDGSGLTGISASGSTTNGDNAIIADNDNNGSGQIDFVIGSGGSAKTYVRVDNNGNLGIGETVTTPTHKLEVEGTTLLDATSGDGVFFNVSGGNNVFGIKETTTNNIIHFGSMSDNDQGINFNVSTGAVGIGTTAPSGLFEVTDIIYDDGDCSDNPGYTQGDFDGEADVDDCKKIGLNVNSSANVGIGTASPSHLLDVAGHINSENVKTFYVSRTLPTTVNQTVQLGSFSNDATNILEIGVTVQDTTKRYLITLDNNDGTKIVPAFQTNFGTDSSNDFDLIGAISGTSLLLKVRRLAGTDQSLYVHIKSYTNNPFTETSTVEFDNTTVSYHQGSPLRIQDDKIRVNGSAAEGEAMAISVSSSSAGQNFAITDGSGTDGYEYRIVSNNLRMGYVSNLNLGTTPSNEFIFATDGTFTATNLVGDGSSLTNVTAATLTSTGNLTITADSDNNDASSNIVFEDGSGTEVSRFNSSGSLGINTLTPADYMLSPNSGDRAVVVSGTSSNGSLVLNNAIVPDDTNGLSASSTAVAGIIDFMVEQNEGSVAGAAGKGRTIEAGDSVASIKANLDGAGSIDAGSYTDGYGGALTFFTKRNSGNTSSLQRMKIDSEGDIMIGNSTQKPDVYIQGTLCVGSASTCGNTPGAAGGIEALSYTTAGADYAEYFDSEGDLRPGDIVGLNPNTGKARYYQAGDILMGIVSTNPGLVGNSLAALQENTSMVGLMGQLPFNRDQVKIDGHLVKTIDGKIIGNQLASGMVYLNISSKDNAQDREIASLKKENKDLKARVERLENLVNKLIEDK